MGRQDYILTEQWVKISRFLPQNEISRIEKIGHDGEIDDGASTFPNFIISNSNTTLFKI